MKKSMFELGLAPLVAMAGAIVLAFCPGTAAAATTEALDTALAADRQSAMDSLRAATAAAEQAKTAAASRAAALDAAATAAKGDLAGLQKQLLAVLSKDDPIAIRATRALLSARQTALDAEEGEAALAQKEAEEAERDRDAWKKRAATLELALRMDMKVMLAGPAEIDDRDKRVDAAEKDVGTQEAQIRKYTSRRDAVAAKREILLRRLAALAQSVASDGPAELQQAKDEEVRQLQRLVVQQEQWFRLNRALEERARRNLAFARTDCLISRRFAEALAHKSDLRRADELASLADRGDAQLAALRAKLPPVQQEITTNLTAATGQAEAALRTLGEARTAQEDEQAHAAYAQAQLRKVRWESENDCWKEFVSLQKAGAAFARELADRARSLAEERNIADINQEEEQLRASLVTSEQYVHSLEAQVQKIDAQIESARRDLGLTPPHMADLATPLADLFASFDASHPPAASLVADLLRSLAERLPEGDAAARATAERRRETGAMLVARLAQREMLRVRKGISERWLENSRAAIQMLERLAGHQLWQQHDPRLNAVACQETLALAGAVADSVVFTGDCWNHGIAGTPGVPGLRRMLAGTVLVLLLWLAGWLAPRAIPVDTRLRRLARKLVLWLLPLAVAAWMALAAGRENLALFWLGWLLLSLAGWVLIRNLLLALTREHRAPPDTTAGAALLTAVNTILLWSVALVPFYRVAGLGNNAWDTQAVLARLWLFGICLALFHLVMHASFAGRFLSRRSENRVLRWLGSFAAVACVFVAALVAVTYLASLDSLGRSMLHTAEGTFAVLVAVLVGIAILGGLARRHAAKSGFVVLLIRIAQAIVLCASAASAGWLWWLLLNRAVLANNAPPPVPEIVRAMAQAMHSIAWFWHAQLTAGMTVASLMRGLLVFVASFWVSRQAKNLMHERVLSRTPMDEATRQTFVNVLGYIVIVLGFLVGLNVAGSSLQNLALLAGAITVGVGFGLQNVINNFVSSLLIHFGRSIRVGDYIDVGGTRGTVKEIGMRNTVLVTDDEITVLVPNGSFITANSVNWTNPSRRTRLHLPVVVTRQADLTAVAELAVAAASRIPLILKNPAPTLEVRTVTATQVSLDVQIWSERPEKAAAIVGELGLALDHALREKGFAV